MRLLSRSQYRSLYDDIVTVRAMEIELPEAKKQLKTETFQKIESEIRRINKFLGAWK